MQEMWVRSLGREDPVQKEMATHSSILAWEIPCLVGKKRRAIVTRKRVDDRGRVVGEIQNADVVFERMRAI